MRLQLIGGSYQARSVIANAQRCINLYPEINQKDAPVPLTYYQRPGLKALAQDVTNSTTVRGLYTASNGNGYAVIGKNVYRVTPSFGLTLLGSLAANLITPVAWTDNGIELLLVDGTTAGYQIVLASDAFTPIVDGTGIFQGATRVSYLDTFIIWNLPGTNQFGSTLSNELQFNPTYTAGKTSFPDHINSLAVIRSQITLLGQYKSEIWFDAGNPLFPFARLPDTSFEHGCGAPYSLAQADTSLFFVGQNLQGTGFIMKMSGYQMRRISTHAIETIIQSYPTTSDAIGFCVQFDGHLWYVLSFPSGNATWVWDDATELWHQWCYTDPQGKLQRHRANCGAFMYGKLVCGDWKNGSIYEMSRTAYTDQLVPNGPTSPISFIRTFPHVQIAEAQGQPGSQMLGDGKQIMYEAFQADIEVGNAPLDPNGNPYPVTLRFSDDRGRTFNTDQLQSDGAPGEYRTRPLWRGLGAAMDRIYELEHSIPAPAALNGAWVQAKVLDQ